MEIRLLLAGLVVLAVLFAGCSSESPQNVTTLPTTVVNQPKYVAGDIIAKTTTSADSMWLIVKYDAKTDKYERALAYKKSDGSWYRKDERTELSDRALTEKLYPAKVTHVSSISAVPVVTPTTIPVTTSTTATSTTAPLAAPTVNGITPSSGMVGATMNITGITGTNFRSGATVRLGSGAATIVGSSVTIVSVSDITCQFVIPSNAAIGAWNVTVINSDGQSGSLTNGFTITNGTSAPQNPIVNGITPASATSGVTFNVTNLAGSNLLNVTSVKLTRSGSADFLATNVSVVSATQVTCTFNLAAAATGTWNVTAINPDGQSGTFANGFTVTTAITAPPVANFTNMTPRSGIPPLTVTFNDISTGSPTSWNWIFGDIGAGNTSTSQNPWHMYTINGTYSVTLTVSNEGGNNTLTLSNYITVG
jgi:hypothetical protein